MAARRITLGTTDVNATGLIRTDPNEMDPITKELQKKTTLITWQLRAYLHSTTCRLIRGSRAVNALTSQESLFNCYSQVVASDLVRRIDRIQARGLHVSV